LLIKLRNQRAEPLHLFLKIVAVRHMPP
jgi:hypothetical protein